MNEITLENSFHGTSIRVRTEADNQLDAWIEIQAAVYGVGHPTKSARARLRRVEKALCGMSDCTCGVVRP